MTKAEPARLLAHAVSSAGKVREDNQDCVQVCDPDDPQNEHLGWLYAIADGMGGYSHGGIASAVALETFFATIQRSSPGPTQQIFKKAVQEANVRVYQEALRLGVHRMGTTLTAIGVTGNQLHLAHVGDSRAYLIRNGNATCLTVDHTTVGELVRMKVLSPDKVRTHAQRSVLNKCLGIELFVQPDVTRVEVQPGDTIILCTDGIWSHVEDDEFAQIAAVSADVVELSNRLHDLALERDSDDNVSVIAVYIERLSSVVPVSASRGWTLPQFLRGRFSDKS